MNNPLEYSLSSCSHFVFTAFPFENLAERGFVIDQSLNREEFGVVVQTLQISTPNQAIVSLEFREIMDEEEFVKESKKLNPMFRGRDVLRPQLGFYGNESHRQMVGMIPVEIIQWKVEQKEFLTKKQNPNTVRTIDGIYLGLNQLEIQEWTDFLQRPPINNCWKLSDGTQIYIASPGDGLYEFMNGRKDFPFWAVILKAESFVEFKNQADPEKIFEWRGQPVALIKEHLTDWDILVL